MHSATDFSQENEKKTFFKQHLSRLQLFQIEFVQVRKFSSSTILWTPKSGSLVVIVLSNYYTKKSFLEMPIILQKGTKLLVV